MDLTAFPWGAVGTLTPPVLLMIVVLMIMRGDLIPRRTAEREMGAKDQAADDWKQAAEVRQEQVTTLSETNRVLATEVGQTVTKVMEELQARARKGADGS